MVPLYIMARIQRITHYTFCTIRLLNDLHTNLGSENDYVQQTSVKEFDVYCLLIVCVATYEHGMVMGAYWWHVYPGKHPSCDCKWKYQYIVRVISTRSWHHRLCDVLSVLGWLQLSTTQRDWPWIISMQMVQPNRAGVGPVIVMDGWPISLGWSPYNNIARVDPHFWSQNNESHWPRWHRDGTKSAFE